MASTTETPKRRRHFAISLRALMLLVLLAALPIGWKVNRAHAQRRAVAAVLAAHGRVGYDFERTGALEPPGPAWLRGLLGDEYFREVVVVELRADDPGTMAAVGRLDRLEYLSIEGLREDPGNALAEIGKLERLQDLRLSEASGLRDDMLAPLEGLPDLVLVIIGDADIGDAGLARLARPPNLKELQIRPKYRQRLGRVTDAGVEAIARSTPGLLELELIDADVTDAALASIGRLSKLKALCLSSPKLTDAGLARLSGLRDLETLMLGRADVTDEGLERIGHPERLSLLSIDSDKITDAGLAHLATLTNLEDLRINSSAITDAGLAQIAGFTKLGRLDLSRGHITDAGLARLKGLPGLVDLNLGGTAITDAAVPDLLALATLSRLDISNTAITDAGLARLQALPSLAILNVTLKPSGITPAGVAAFQQARPNVYFPGPLKPPAANPLDSTASAGPE